MGLYLAVAQGSHEEPRFIHLAWKPPGARRRLVLVGKGVTFDSGGLSLKTNEGMLDMKTDMAGAAAVLAATVAAGEEKLPVEVHALAACTENMPSGNSYKLGDVLRSLNGKTVEINNTDAEGRLTLADAMTFGLRLRPDALLDFATLTGACMVALGPHIAGLMSNDDALAAAFLVGGRAVGRGDVALASAAAAGRAAQVGDRRPEEHRRTLGRCAHGRVVLEGVRRRRPLGSRGHRGSLKREQRTWTHRQRRNWIRRRFDSQLPAPQRDLTAIWHARRGMSSDAERDGEHRGDALNKAVSRDRVRGP